MKVPFYILAGLIINIAFTIDATPTFDAGSTSTFSVPENTAIGTSVGAVLATGDGSITYIIAPSSPFGVAADGKISVNGLVDFESLSSLTLTITASDDGDSTNANHNIAVTITDVTDAPVFSPSTYAFTIADQSPAGTTVGAVTATSSDGTASSYSITAGNLLAHFKMTNDELLVNDGVTLSQSTTSSYALTVQATDGTQTTDVIVPITVTVLPNNLPAFSQTAYTFNVDDGATAGTQVGTVTITDSDSSDTFTFSFTSGNNDGHYAITNTGNLKTGTLAIASGHIITCSISTYSLNIAVNDGTDNAAATVEITINGCSHSSAILNFLNFMHLSIVVFSTLILFVE